MADLLDNLDPEQRAAAEAVSGPVCIIAGAGTGKTRTITYRLAHAIHIGAIDPGRALAVTHSRKAAGELAARLKVLGAGRVEAKTFHAAGLKVARQFWAQTGRLEGSLQVMGDRDAWVTWRDSVRAVLGREPDDGDVRDVMDEVAWARSRLVRPDAYERSSLSADRDPGVGPDVVVKCWGRYEQAKDRRGLVDYADLLEIASELLKGNADIAARVRRKWAYLTVDEYQDTDPAQQHLLDAIIGPGHDVCVVGDPRQAIYSWKGADPTYLTGFTARYPGAQVVHLSRNYRSTPQILDWGNRLASNRQTKALISTRPTGPAPRITRHDSDGAEAAWVAGAVRKAIASGTPPSEIAILYRFNSAQARFEPALTRAGVAYTVADDEVFFERDEVRHALKAFNRAAAAQPDTSGVELLLATLTRSGFHRDAPPTGHGAARRRWESLQALVELAEGSASASTLDAASLAGEINQLATTDQGPRGEGVTLATLHRAKGLEWDLVIVVGATDGAIPSVYATTDDALAEEERLLHVGVTRARQELHVTWSATNSRGRENRPSPYFDLLHPTWNLARAHRNTTRGSSERQPPGAVARDSTSCPHCAAALKGLHARRLGICANCITASPGRIGARARALAEVVNEAAKATGQATDYLGGPTAIMRLLDQRPTTAEAVSATTGVRLTGPWAQAVAKALTD